MESLIAPKSYSCKRWAAVIVNELRWDVTQVHVCEGSQVNNFGNIMQLEINNNNNNV